MNEYVGVVEVEARSPWSAFRSTTFVSQIGRSMIEWKYTNGTCLVAYWSSAFAASLWSAWPSGGWRQVFGSVDEEAMSSAYCFQVRPFASSWSPIVGAAVGYTQPCPIATPSGPTAPANSE